MTVFKYIQIADGIKREVETVCLGSGLEVVEEGGCLVLRASATGTSLIPKQIVYGSSNGSIGQSPDLYFDETTGTLHAASIEIEGANMVGRVLYLGANNRLTTSSSLNFSGGVLTVPTLSVTTLESGRVPYVSAGVLATSGNLAFDGSVLTASTIKVQSLTPNRFVVTASDKTLTTTNLSYNPSTMTLTVENVIIPTLASGRVLITGAGGAVTASDLLLFNSSTGELKATSIELGSGDEITNTSAGTISTTATEFALGGTAPVGIRRVTGGFVELFGNPMLGGTGEVISGSTNPSTSHLYTDIQLNGANTSTLNDGANDGQLKIITIVSENGTTDSLAISVANGLGFSTITFNETGSNVGDTVVLLWRNGKWRILSARGNITIS